MESLEVIVRAIIAGVLSILLGGTWILLSKALGNPINLGKEFAIAILASFLYAVVFTAVIKKWDEDLTSWGILGTGIVTGILFFLIGLAFELPSSFLIGAVEFAFAVLGGLYCGAASCAGRSDGEAGEAVETVAGAGWCVIAPVKSVTTGAIHHFVG